MEKTKVCVTGGSSFLGSRLVKKLLEKGYIVHATLRTLDDEVKVNLLKSLPNADTRLVLFEADIYRPAQFQPAIQGCRYVFHVATPLLHNHDSQYKDTVEAAIGGVRIIADSCLKSQSVRRLVYTGSVMASSPLKDDGTGYKDYIDESCWTPLNLSLTYGEDFTLDYTKSKTLAEREILSYNEHESETNIEVVSLNVGVVGGDTLLPYVPSSVEAIISPVRGRGNSELFLRYRAMLLLQELLGCIPLVHIDDVIEAHLFCIEKPSIKGRFLCANADPTLAEIFDYYRANYPEFQVSNELFGGERGSKCNSTELVKQGFEFKFNMAKIIDDSVECGRRLGVFSNK